MAPPLFSLQRQAAFMRDYRAAHPCDKYSDGVLPLLGELRRKSSF